MEFFKKTLRIIFIENFNRFRTDEDLWYFTEIDLNYSKLFNLLNKPIKDLYNEYLDSEDYNVDIQDIKKFMIEHAHMNKERCNDYIRIYKKFSHDLLSYYMV